ncbi:YTP1 protein [Sodiomyces alkalinus F11]|uniref:YTP1 protein n=1 Tax=Sodiomyces alkalinus (strain CBS 110278 / VKM F-3762 / F11) TaxID=1314773 RepID=A0A3N2PIZ7_SODAK|nr:YTP1 protein [Sodiomyces alkalinus F11]ROT34509.1 YTP1 protein [Sodiomyces alkalinus F11]
MTSATSRSLGTTTDKTTVVSRRIAPLASIIILASFPTAVLAHDHGENKIPEGHVVSPEPLDATLWVHIFLMMLAFGVIFPVGMVLGVAKNRWHVPTQALGTVIAIVAWFLGHAHKGRQFVSGNVHARFANILMFLLAGQVVFGGYLKLHLEKGIHGRIRRVVRPLHGVLGKAMPVLSWTQIVFGVITALGFCQGDHLGQCAAHFIMGSAFIAYGILLTLVLLVGQLWLRRTGRSQEFFDSAVIAAWGCVNTFTEHRWGTGWVKNDWQHTTMGVIWWSAGLAGIWLSRDRDGNPKRNFIPAFVIAVTGWGMSAHPQDLPVSAMTHSMFGKTLMATGLSRIIEIAFVLKDKPSLSDDGRQYNSWQLIPVFLLYASGLLFMGATEEQMDLVASSSMDHISYILILYSLAFLMFLFVNINITMYDYISNAQGKVVLANGEAPQANGHHRSVSETRQLRDAEEFELEGLISDEEDERKKPRRRADDDDSLDSPGATGAGASGGRVAL